MKRLFLFSLLCLSPLILSQTAAAEARPTVLTMTPWWPIDCATTNAPEVNRHGPLEKLQDDESVAIWGFKTVVGSCQNGQFNAGPLSTEAQANVDRDKWFTLQSHVEAHVQLLSANDAYVTLVFDKKAIFKNKSSDRFLMTFYPNGIPKFVLATNVWGQTYWYQPGYIGYPWKVRLVQVSPNDTQLDVDMKSAEKKKTTPPAPYEPQPEVALKKLKD